MSSDLRGHAFFWIGLVAYICSCFCLAVLVVFAVGFPSGPPQGVRGGLFLGGLGFGLFYDSWSDDAP